jgi:hypothetical protein
MAPSSGVECTKKEGMLISQVLYLKADGAPPDLAQRFVSGRRF